MNLFKTLYATPFRLIGLVLQTFASNRKRMREFVSRPSVARALKIGMAVTMLLWFAVVLLIDEEEQNRLTEAVEAMWPQATDDSAVSTDSEEIAPVDPD